MDAAGGRRPVATASSPFDVDQVERERDVTQPALILLPGLDGTGNLFEKFAACAPSDWPLRTLQLPSERPRASLELAGSLLAQLPKASGALIAASFSGPLAILLANRCSRVRAVVLCATFVRRPLPGLLARGPKFLWNW